MTLLVPRLMLSPPLLASVISPWSKRRPAHHVETLATTDSRELGARLKAGRRRPEPGTRPPPQVKSLDPDNCALGGASCSEWRSEPSVVMDDGTALAVGRQSPRRPMELGGIPRMDAPSSPWTPTSHSAGCCWTSTSRITAADAVDVAMETLMTPAMVARMPRRAGAHRREVTDDLRQRRVAAECNSIASWSESRFQCGSCAKAADTQSCWHGRLRPGRASFSSSTRPTPARSSIGVAREWVCLRPRLVLARHFPIRCWTVSAHTRWRRTCVDDA